MRKKLLDELMLDKAPHALRHYPTGCPPPAAIVPICPPLQDDAELLYVPQHTRSSAEQAFLEGYISTRLEYGIDEPGNAYANLPLFTVPKPDTEDRRVIFDDSVGSTINMQKLGMKLPNTNDVKLFLPDARLITSVDLASFFTAIPVAEDARDHWTYDGGAHGRMRSRRLIQGNSVSPAIAQAFLTQILENISGLRSKLIWYIDNIYLKSTDGNEKSHIKDIGTLVRGLAR